MYSRLGVSTKIPSDMGPQQVIFSENRKTEKKQTKIDISIKSVFKWRVRDCFAFNELLIRVYYKRRKNQGKTEEILLEFVSIFDTARSLPSVIGDVKMEGFDSTDSHELAFIRPVSYVA